MTNVGRAEILRLVSRIGRKWWQRHVSKSCCLLKICLRLLKGSRMLMHHMMFVLISENEEEEAIMLHTTAFMLKMWEKVSLIFKENMVH